MARIPVILGAVLALSSTASATVLFEFHNMKMAHAVISPLVFALFLPLGAMMIRVFTFRGILWFHGSWMIFSYIQALAALGTGIYLAYYIHLLDTAHSIIGLVVVCGCTLQPVIGIAHHLLYKNIGRPNKATFPHVWWGRALITLGAVNGGLGLQLTWSTPQVLIGYGVGAGTVWSLWMIIILVAFLRSREKLEDETGEKIFGSNTISGQIKQGGAAAQVSLTESDKHLVMATVL